MRAHAIFESKGLLKLLKEVKSKLKMLNSSVKLAAGMVAADALDSGDESGKEGGSPERKSTEGALLGGKKKKIVKKKPKKTVYRNNFIKESNSNNNDQ